MSNYELISVGSIDLTADISLLAKTSDIFFNATQMASKFNKRPDDFWKQKQNKEYLQALITLNGGNKNSYVFTKNGKYGGTWLHKDLALQFARWLNSIFAVRLDYWIRKRIQKENDWKQKRLEAKTGFLPMTDAIQGAHESVQHYHFSNESDLINKIVLGRTAKQYKKHYGVSNVRDAVLSYELDEINKLQIINTGMILLDREFQERKLNLTKCHNQKAVNLPYISGKLAEAV